MTASTYFVAVSYQINVHFDRMSKNFVATNYFDENIRN